MRAMVVSAAPDSAGRICSLLRECGISEADVERDGRAALARLRERTPGLLLADAALPGIDGAALMRRVTELPLSVYPGMILLTVPGPVQADQRRAELCGGIALEKPVDAAALQSAIDSVRPGKRRVPVEKRVLAEKLLDNLGVPAHSGREYLLRAVLLAWQDARYLERMTARLYPEVAECFGVTCRHVERAMRHAIDRAWQSGAFDAQYRIFGETIDAKRGTPTCGEMIAQIADILRWEGKG